MTSIQYPNFFILGAAKSGTTTLYRHLKKHPDIFLCAEKEPNYYNPGFQIINTESEYKGLYESKENEVVIGEASHAYLTNPASVRLLKEYHPNAKFVVILRNPAQRAYSLFNHMLRHGYETENCFEKALLLEETRFNSEKFNALCDENIWNFAYFKSGLYGEQIERYLMAFDEHQFHFLTLNELASQPEKTISKIITFLGLMHHEMHPLDKQNDSTKIPLSPRLRKLTRKCSSRHSRSFLFRAINRVNTKNTPPLKVNVYDSLMSKYHDDLAKLNRLIGIDLS